MPTGQPWQKSDRVVSPAEHRYLMTVVATASNPRFTVSRVDIDRGGPTYTIDTLRDLAAVYPDAELFFITGADALGRDLHLARRRRGSSSWPTSSAAPGRATRWTRAMLAGIPSERVTPDRDPRAGDLLQRLPPAPGVGRAGLVPRARRRRAVHRQARPLSPPRRTTHMTATDRAIELVTTAAQAASDKLASNLLAFDVSEQLVITDAFLLCSATNERQVKSIVDEVEDKLREHRRQAGPPRGRARRPLGADRLRRHRRPRAARGGAAVLRPRTALARLPDDRPHRLT